MDSIRGLSDIIDRFDAVVTDQFGVLHDGDRVFDGALAALRELAARKIPVVTLTNSGKRAHTNAARLARMGLTPDLVGTVISSGELAREHLETMRSGTPIGLITRDGETELIDGLNLRKLDLRDNESPELIVLAGIQPETISQTDYGDLLARHARAKVPMLLVNPDLLMGQGTAVFFGAGAVARDYSNRGGQVTPLGKPSPAMFKAALATLANPKPNRVLMIGDSPAHDIGGASDAGLATLLVRSGVQAGLRGHIADYTVDQLRWD
ncbi:TIGR01459 family HAD-type hydrolase [Ruegeria sp. 2205SS24-7]|uniref:TIGR01459 family HAD-type hydrolase n=1 Tax=Ruegeria discodermiae TaxID=3064389 RepID=UPI0027403581|nr:TIGR01459 family HAD-type hydrolase [Ruegeria sp. 2205SS24-7]MDP5220960.1 TIGR01459 family HAD-type hydrolase [Ruegeria sp. 2205SS24-7]